MILRHLTAALGASILTAATIVVADAYPAIGPNFVERAGSAAALTERGTLMQPVPLALRTLLEHAGRDGTFSDKRNRAAVAEFYNQRGYQPVWSENGALVEKAKAVIDRIARADEDGLNPADYILPGTDLAAGAADAEALAGIEVRLSVAIGDYARHAYAGRFDPRSLGKDDVPVKPHLLDPIEVLASVADAADPAATLHAFNPGHEGYKRLRAKLAEIRAEEKAAKEYAAIPAGRGLIRAGDADERVPLIRARLDLSAEVEQPNIYDDTVVDAVRIFQSKSGLVPDGVVGPATISVMNQGPIDRTAEIVANMERWRWLPRDLGKVYVQVNVPAFELQVRDNGKVIHETRVVVGKTSNKTPIFSDRIQHLIVNPYWNVPFSIKQKEMRPEIMADPGSLNRQNFEVLANIRGRATRIDPYQIDWHNVNMNDLHIRQRPGAGNALGEVKFMFPNQHAVYLHDTPSKSLFQRGSRAFSHGCVRVMNPWDFAGVLLKTDPQWSLAKVKAMIGSGTERRVDLKNHIPVHLTYFTAWVDEAGTLQMRPDVYGHQAKTKAALKL